MSSLIFLILLIYPLIAINAVRNSPNNSSPKFSYVNEGKLFGSLSAEYGATYRPLPVSKPPFQLCFYNTTPNSYTLALGMFATGSSHHRDRPSIRWVWEANRGKPIRDNAKLVFQQDGNLILVDIDGHGAWQTNTGSSASSMKIVTTKLRLSGKGNLILHARNGSIIWQSFDHPTDTLLMGQSFIREEGRPNYKLVSRASNRVNMDGRYSLVMERERIAFYYQGRNSPKPLVYDVLYEPEFQFVDYMTFDTFKSKKEFNLILRFNFWVVEDVRHFYIIASMKYDSHLSFLRLGVDGNFRAFTYNNETGSWNQTFIQFGKNEQWDSGCQLPERCGRFGLCDNSQCIGCPSPSGVSNWTKNCSPPMMELTSCKVEDFGYYKLEGVTHYTAFYANEHKQFVEESDCRKICTEDCKCLAYFYEEIGTQCSFAYDLKTLWKVTNNVTAYIKYKFN